MALSLRGRNIHKYLVAKAVKYFSEKGYTIVKEAKMSGKTRIDVLAIKGSERVGIECQLTISYDIIKKKFRDYGSNLTKFVFVIPVYREAKVRLVLDKISKEEKLNKNFFEIWPEDVDVTTTIRLSKKGKKVLDEVARDMGKFGETYDDVLLKLIEHYKRCNRVKK